MLEILYRVFQRKSFDGKLPGSATELHHVVNECTHCAFNARLRDCDGYSFNAYPEASAALCPDYPKKGVWSKDQIMLNRCLEAANGGSYHYDTQQDVLNRRRQAVTDPKSPVPLEGGVHFLSTNINFVFFQQQSVLRNWWAQAEAKYKIGLANRFIFTSSRRSSQVDCSPGLKPKLEIFIEATLQEP